MSKFFINRPIVAMVISILMVIVGGVAIFSLPTAQFPEIADPQIQVNATYPGADALTADQSVATPIEQKMSGVDNMEYMYSLNQNSGLMWLTVDFNVKTDPNTDLILAQMRQSQAASQLPTEVNAQGGCRSEIYGCSAHVVRPLLPGRKVRRSIPGQLLLHQSR
jgi:HAE1 family hydrophobic/amphiphilic exporter-1